MLNFTAVYLQSSCSRYGSCSLCLYCYPAIFISTSTFHMLWAKFVSFYLQQQLLL